ncbi:methyltransferase domain-containing protein [Desulfoscipio sp. XC116]|uniref:class I SAM-dependent methyltransferase n=1 Tax=Desulfoscipio sp. XC116 TaxID=3144975 RepID=UPI00325AD3EE
MMKHREWFDSMAAKWDSTVLEDKKCQLLFDLITGLNIVKGSRVLDVATGTGILIPRLLNIIGKEGELTAIDFAEKMIARAQSKFKATGVNFLVADVMQLPFGDNNFDEIICNSAFPHFTHQPKAMQEMARVLKTGARLIICNPAPREELNEFHRSLGGVVGNDMLPAEPEMRHMARQAGLEQVLIQDGPYAYLFTAIKTNAV